MTQNRTIELTPEEQAELSKTMPDIVERIERRDRQAIAALNGLRYRMSLLTQAKEQAEEIKREVAAAIEASGLEQGHLAHWCGFPTDMTRCSPFFPMRNNELGHRVFLRNFPITSANWGEILYTGPQLSIYEEDALLALLFCIEKNKHYTHTSYFLDYETGPGEVEVLDEPRPYFVTFQNENDALPKTLTYKGPALPILKMLYKHRNPSKSDYKHLVDSLELMTVAGVKLSISTGKTKSGKRRAPRITQMSAMLAGVYWDDQKKELTATINPFFYETYMAGQVTLMDVAKRMSLKGLNAKALYRFVQSQRQNPVFAGHFLTLADALNMDREQPAYQLRRQLKTAISELIRQGVLMKKSGFVDTDIIKLERTADTLSATKTQALEKR